MKTYMKNDLKSLSLERQCLSPVSNGAKEFDHLLLCGVLLIIQQNQPTLFYSHFHFERKYDVLCAVYNYKTHLVLKKLISTLGHALLREGT